jgi:hypothetical protein
MRWELAFPSEYIRAADMGGKSVNVTIEKVIHDSVMGTNGKKVKKLIVYMKGTEKKWILNKTNCKRIAKMHGPETNDWAGKKVPIHVEQVEAFGEQVDAIRVTKKNNKQDK